MRWNHQPGNVQFAAVGLGVGAVFGLLTKNVVGAIGVGLLIAIVAFKWPGIHARVLVGVVVVAGCLAIAFGTADINPVNGYPVGGGGYSDSPYTCGSVVKNPIKNPLSDWKQIEREQTSDGYDKKSSTFVLDDCASRMKSFRIDTAVLLGVALLALLGAVAIESSWRRQGAAGESAGR